MRALQSVQNTLRHVHCSVPKPLLLMNNGYPHAAGRSRLRIAVVQGSSSSDAKRSLASWCWTEHAIQTWEIQLQQGLGCPKELQEKGSHFQGMGHVPGNVCWPFYCLLSGPESAFKACVCKCARVSHTEVECGRTTRALAKRMPRWCQLFVFK